MILLHSKYSQYYEYGWDNLELHFENSRHVLTVIKAMNTGSHGLWIDFETDVILS